MRARSVGGQHELGARRRWRPPRPGVRAPTSAVLTAGLPSTQASAIWLSGDAARLGHLAAQPLHHADVASCRLSPRKMRLAEGDARRAPVRLGRTSRGGGERAGQQAVAERAVAHHPDAVVAHSTGTRLLLHPPVEACGSPPGDVHAPDAHAGFHLLDGEVRHAHEADLARPARSRPARECFLERRRRCPASGSGRRPPSRCGAASGSRRPRAGCWPASRRAAARRARRGPHSTPHLVTRMTSCAAPLAARCPTTSSECPPP